MLFSTGNVNKNKQKIIYSRFLMNFYPDKKRAEKRRRKREEGHYIKRKKGAEKK